MSDGLVCPVCGLGGHAYLRCQYAGCPDGRGQVASPSRAVEAERDRAMHDCEQMAAEIARLRAENQRLREVLLWYAAQPGALAETGDADA